MKQRHQLRSIVNFLFLCACISSRGVAAEARSQGDFVGVPIPGIPYERFETKDGYGRTISSYLSTKTREKLPLAVFVAGSGCSSYFSKRADGSISGGYQNILLNEAQGRFHVLVVEKPGVNFLDAPEEPGTAFHCSTSFHQEHTLNRYVEALQSALQRVLELSQIDRSRILLIGHSEGGIAVAHLAVLVPEATQVAILSGSGPSQLFDLAYLASKTGGDAEVYQTYEAIRSDPDSTSRFAWGHPYRRWASFMAHSTVDALCKVKAQIYLAHGTADRSVPVESFDVLRAELIRRGSHIEVERREGADHSLNEPDQTRPQGMIEVFDHVLDWSLRGSR